MAPTPDYEPRYLAGIVLFNRHDYFDAHEVWESLWLSEAVGADRRFVQGLIQAAVGLYHFGNGNLRGALKLYKSGRAYMEAYPSPHLGLEISGFWGDMERCYAELLAQGPEAGGMRLDESLRPQIELRPPPDAWPDPAPFLHEDED
ncbi:MAG: DUF309 domain-containing protein [Gemmataceae bacterium]